MANFFDDAGFVNGADLVEDYPAVGFDAFCFEASGVGFRGACDGYDDNGIEVVIEFVW